jgi:pSer/pThr/pTyr-binding forkhead associated (FHA) protein
MSAFLNPVSHPDLGKIVIEDDIFHIGRNEAPFANNQNEIGRTLSRRHARLFQEQGIFYVADMGSLNGTTVNGKVVKNEPVRLEPGDELCFANKVTFTFEPDKRPEKRNTGASAASAQLTLVPEAHQDQLNSIVVTQFPFLIGKMDSIFAQNKNPNADLIRYVSRRHALIFAKGDDLYIEDLGSKNGTFVGDERLDEHAKTLSDGDRISFGSREHFAYSVKIQKRQKPDVIDNAPAKLEQGRRRDIDRSVQRSGSGKTTYVATATSFLDIFCLDEHTQQPDEESPGLASAHDYQGKDSPAPAQNTAASHNFARVWNKVKTFFRELCGALSDEDWTHAKAVWMLIAIVLIMGLIPVGLYLYGGPQRDIRTALSEEKYGQAADLADEYLRDNPNDASIALLGAEALMKHIVPQWMTKLANGEFQQATVLLDNASPLTEFNEDGQQMLAVLKWITDLELFIEERGGRTAPIKLFDHEIKIAALLRRWNKDSVGHQELMHRILTYVPSFAEVHSRAFSYLRGLREEQSLYVKAIEDLKSTIANKLAAGEIENLSAKIDSFAKRYSRIQGIEVLRADLNQYAAIEKAMKDGRIQEVNRLLAQMDFKTPIFREWIQQQASAMRLPSPEIASQYERGIDAWRAGNVDKALTIMSALQATDWGDAANRKLSRYQQIIDDFNNLKNIKNQQDYGTQLLLFYRSLDASEDKHFRQRLQEAYQKHKGIRLARAKEAWNNAEMEWHHYLDAGGIDSTERVDPEVSDAFRKKASLLSKAYTYINQANSIYELLAMELSPKQQNLQHEIISEIRRQRQWLEDLRLVMKPELLKGKLDILPLL